MWYTTLISLAQAFKVNPFYLTITIVSYLDGVFINTHLLAVSTNFKNVPLHLSSGAIWIFFVTGVILVFSRQYFPLDIIEARCALASCFLISTTSLGVFLFSLIVNHRLMTVTQELKQATGLNFPLYLKIADPILTILLVVLLFIFAVIRLRKNIDIARRDSSDENAFK